MVISMQVQCIDRVVELKIPVILQSFVGMPLLHVIQLALPNMVLQIQVILERTILLVIINTYFS